MHVNYNPYSARRWTIIKAVVAQCLRHPQKMALGRACNSLSINNVITTPLSKFYRVFITPL